MATEMEVRQCFEALHQQLIKKHAEETERRKRIGGQSWNNDEAAYFFSIFEKGIFILESVVQDLKRIADALDDMGDESAMAQDMKEASGSLGRLADCAERVASEEP